ncbi:hypothetical protein VDGL01_00085 [Verticillium dahliae]
MPPCGARWPVERMPEKHLEERFLDGRPGGQATLKQEAGVLNLTDWKLVPAMGHSASGKEEPVVADQLYLIRPPGPSHFGFRSTGTVGQSLAGEAWLGRAER